MVNIPFSLEFSVSWGKGLVGDDELCGCVCVFPIWWHLLLWCTFWQVFPAMVDSAGLLLGVGVTLRVWVYWESPGRPISRRQCRQWVFRNRHHPHILCCVSWPQNILDGGQLQENRSPVWPHVRTVTIFFLIVTVKSHEHLYISNKKRVQTGNQTTERETCLSFMPFFWYTLNLIAFGQRGLPFAVTCQHGSLWTLHRQCHLEP